MTDTKKDSSGIQRRIFIKQGVGAAFGSALAASIPATGRASSSKKPKFDWLEESARISAKKISTIGCIPYPSILSLYNTF
jgi:hypothetical protein